MKKTKKWVLPSLMILLLGAGGSAYAMVTRAQATHEAAPTYQEIVVRKGEIRIDFEADAAASLPVTQVAFPTSGRLSTLAVELDQSVQEGDLLAQMDDSELLSRIADAEASLQQAVLQRNKTASQRADALKTATARMEALALQVDNAQRKYDSMTLSPEAFSVVELEDAAASLKGALASHTSEKEAYGRMAADRSDLDLADLAVKRASMALEEARAALEETTLHAPVDGTIIRLPLQTGDPFTSTTEIAWIALPSGPEVYALVSELDVADIEMNQAVEMEFEALDGTPYRGRVVSIDPLAVRDGNGLVNYSVLLGLDKPDARILDGMTGTVSFILREKTGILTLPNNAIRMTDGIQTVNIRNEGGIVVPVAITTGLTDGRNVEILSGLDAGAVVLVQEK